jgi:hypothetical protein
MEADKQLYERDPETWNAHWPRAAPASHVSASLPT